MKLAEETTGHQEEWPGVDTMPKIYSTQSTNPQTNIYMHGDNEIIFYESAPQWLYCFSQTVETFGVPGTPVSDH